MTHKRLVFVKKRLTLLSSESKVSMSTHPYSALITHFIGSEMEIGMLLLAYKRL